MAVNIVYFEKTRVLFPVRFHGPAMSLFSWNLIGKSAAFIMDTQILGDDDKAAVCGGRHFVTMMKLEWWIGFKNHWRSRYWVMKTKLSCVEAQG
jgi:hypothetical protein